MNRKISIIGGGISGITTALTLQLLGNKTTIYAEYLVDDKAPEDPKFASLYPAASIIPHSVQSDKVDEMFPLSQQVFEFLLEQKIPGMQLNRHYEIFEEERKDPSYAPFLKNYARIDPNANDLPRRPGAPRLSGWSFDCLFTEWPTYIEKLYKWYKRAGGKIIQKRIAKEEISQIESELIVNCSGIWSPDLFEDSEERWISKGHLIHIKDAPLLRDSAGHIPSYNYTPGKKHYADNEGNAADVYFYPRSNGWILGGSRQHGLAGDHDMLKGKGTGKTISIDGISMPQQIYMLNREILQNTYGIDAGQFNDLSARTGYRYIRKREGPGLRLESTTEYGKTIFHNYGHGGSGVTLSWGCAVYMAGMIEDATDSSTVITATVTKLIDQLEQLIA